jgi:hypothetical protein
MNEYLCNQEKCDNSTVIEIVNDILKNAEQKFNLKKAFDNIDREIKILRLEGDALKKYYSKKINNIFGGSVSYLLSIDETKIELYEDINIDFHLLKESTIDESTIKTMLIKRENGNFFTHYRGISIITELNSRLDELEKQCEQLIEEKSLSDIPEDIKLRHSILLMYELGIIQQLETELRNRGINLAQQHRNYLPNLLSVLMNVNDKSTQETIRKEISQHTKIKPPINPLNKILAAFGLNVENLKVE